MLDFGFSEILLTSAIALVVLGPEKLPKVARQVGNWMGRARVMARQLTEQLDREISAEEFLKQQQQPAARSVPITPAAVPATPTAVPATPAAPAAPAAPSDTAASAAAITGAPGAPETPGAADAANAFSNALRDTAAPTPLYPNPLAPTAAAATEPYESPAAAPAPATEQHPTATGIKLHNE